MDKDIHITINGSQPSRRGSAEYFTGAVRLDSEFKRSGPARVAGAVVTFEPGLQPAIPDRDRPAVAAVRYKSQHFFTV